MAMQYRLENLYVDQDPECVIDCMAAVLAWVPGRGKGRWTQPYVFNVLHEPVPAQAPMSIALELSWDLDVLKQKDPGVSDCADRMRRGKTVLHEDVAKLAAYGLAFVAISAIHPGLKVIRMNSYAAPDLIYDDTPGAIRGVEVAGRSSGGQYVLKKVRLGDKTTTGKQQQLLGRADVAEAHLSLWCVYPRVALIAKVK
ncbi:hypothetical protein [Corallococcus macrosporus]|uniref:hypothetical protein n=1 Tax=Corallococcus macrosporus TaxID=35 RepID=UPI000F5060F9|nr:hypothetical protein [Corallococcus macrosporus]